MYLTSPGKRGCQAEGGGRSVGGSPQCRTNWLDFQPTGESLPRNNQGLYGEFSQQQLRIKHFRFEYWDFSPIKIATWVIHRCLKWLVTMKNTILRSSSIVYRWIIDVYSYSKPWTYPEAAKRRAQAFQKWCQRRASVRVRVPRVPLGIPWTSAVSCVRWRLEWWYDVNKNWKLGNSNFLQAWKSYQHLVHWAKSWSLSPHAEYGHGKLRTNSSFGLWNPHLFWESVTKVGRIPTDTSGFPVWGEECHPLE